MSTMKFLFYAERGEQVGLGHVRRCEALSLEFKKRGWEVDYSPGGKVPYDGIVIDSYVLAPEKIREYKKRCPFLIGFHDKGEPNANFSILISSIYSETATRGRTRILGGHVYRAIHPDALAAPPAAICDSITSLVITFGGSAAMTVFSKEVAGALKKTMPAIGVRVVAGISGQEAAAVFSSTDIAVAGGGQTLLELAYLGVPTVVVSLSEDQDAQIADAAANGFARVAGKLHDARILDSIGETVRSLYARDVRERMHNAGRGYIDGKGAERIADAIAHSFHGKI